MSESGPDDSFNQLYAREFAYVWQTVGRLGHPQRDIADAVHDVFVIVYRRREELDPARSVRPWLFGVARKVVAGARRKDRVDPSDDVDRIEAPPPHAERDLLWRALAQLTEDRRVVVILHDLEGYTGLEIAAQLDISPNTVHSRLRLAREDLVRVLTELRGAA
ncbi:MAG TPA: sigma-70 family RNA polymerase sigma factor [Kofleriaceae bacterium]